MAKQMTVTDVKSFDKGLTSVVNRSKTIRNDIQTLVAFAFSQYAKHGNSGFLERLIVSTKSVRTIRTSTLEAFILFHANVEWVGTGKDKVLKKITGEKRECTFSDQLWYEHNNDGEDAPTVDVAGRYKSLATVVGKTGVVYKNGDRDEKLAAMIADKFAEIDAAMAKWDEEAAKAEEKAAA